CATALRTMRSIASLVPIRSGITSQPGGGTRLKPFGGRRCSAVVIVPPHHFHGIGSTYEERPRRGGDHAWPETEEQRGQEEAAAHGEIPGEVGRTARVPGVLREHPDVVQEAADDPGLI